MALKGTKLLPIFILLTVGSCYGLQCYYAGVFAHPDDCTRMYTCQNQGNAGFILQEHQCPPGTAVDTLTLRCVDASLQRKNVYQIYPKVVPFQDFNVQVQVIFQIFVIVIYTTFAT
ncbi:hypothetical protein B566_EDAN001637 [Ephemera danica]|nr:hypothetical protein B566_EDAN001637 [Ephemera danica]